MRGLKGKFLLGTASAFSVLAVVFGFGLVLAQGGALLEEDLGAAAESDADEQWRLVLALAGAQFEEGVRVSALFGPLPDDDELSRAGGLAPSAFLRVYQGSDRPARIAMQRFVRSRLRELGRRGAFRPGVVAGLIGPEGEGVRGSEFFRVPPVPAESYHALIRHLEFCALELDPDYQAGEDSRMKIDRWLQAALALSSPAGRLQYADFDVVWISLERDLVLSPPEERRKALPGLCWLYSRLRQGSGMEFLPALSEELAREVEAEGGALFAKARLESQNLPASLSALTAWERKLLAPSSVRSPSDGEHPSP